MNLNRYTNQFCLAVAAAILMPLLALGAYAQEAAAGTVVNFDPFIAEVVPYVVALVGAVVAAGVAWITRLLHSWTGIQIEARHRDALQSALMNGARSAIAGYTPNGVRIDLKHPVVSEGVRFVLSSVPDAVKYFGLSPADIERHLLPKIAVVTTEAAPAKPAVIE